MPEPAAIGTNGHVVFNAAAEMVFSRDSSARKDWVDGIASVHGLRTAVERTIATQQVVFFPVFSDDNRIEAIAGIAGTLADLPRLLHLFQRETLNFTEIVHQAPSVVLTARPGGQIDYLSRRWFEIAPSSDASQPPGESLKAAIPERFRRAFSTAWTAGIAGMRDFTMTTPIETVFGLRRFELSVRPVRLSKGHLIKWVGSLSDVEDAASATDDLRRLKNRLLVLAQVGKVIAASRTLADLVDGVEQLSRINPAERWFVELRHPGDIAIQRGISVNERRGIDAMLLRREWTTVADWDQTGAPKQYVVSTIADRGTSLGFVGFTREGPGGEEDLLLTEEVANRIALSVDRLLSFLREQELARTLQRSMLPLALPYSPGVRLDVAYEPAQRQALVGGDWYDAFELPDSRIVVAIGDVAGHGLDAAIVMNQVRHAMQTAVIGNPDPAAVLGAANRQVNAQGHPMVTALFGILDPLTLEFTCASAGHPPAAIVYEDGRVRSLPCDGIPLGISDEFSVKNISEELPAGGALVLYTDGVVEDERDLPAGERALEHALSEWARHGFVARAADLQTQLRVGSHHDDAAMFVLRFPHVDEFEVRLPATPYNAQRMRLAARRFVAGSPFENDRAFDAVLAVGEAVNNAVVHAYDEGGGMMALSLKRETQRLIVDVRDEGVWREPKPTDRLHGLGIIELLADKLQIVRTEHGTSVHIEVAYAPSQMAATA